MNEVHKLLPPKDKKKQQQLNTNIKRTQNRPPITTLAIGKGFSPPLPLPLPIGLADHSKETIQHSSF